jgi:hypothetical protein
VIVPIYKRGRRVVGGNHRPVNLLVVIMKILQRVVYKRIEDFFERKR